MNVTLIGIRVFAYVIKLKWSHWGRWVMLCECWCPVKRGEEIPGQTHWGKTATWQGGSDWSDISTGQMGIATRSWGRHRANSLWALEGPCLASDLISNLWPLVLREGESLLFEGLLCYLWQSWETHEQVWRCPIVITSDCACCLPCGRKLLQSIFYPGNHLLGNRLTIVIFCWGTTWAGWICILPSSSLCLKPAS